MNSVISDVPATVRPTLRILLSAYACEPFKGSEPGVGWNWAVSLARAGHEVWVMTRANNRGAIERALAVQPIGNLKFVYHDLAPWMLWWKRGGRGVRLYYVLWQWGAFQIARRLTRELQFDVVHHITFGVFRHPSFMAFLDAPFVFGPVGGGETAPSQLRKTFPLRGHLIDRVRDIANRMVRVDPVMAAVYRRSAAILCKTKETMARIPARYRNKCTLQLELGVSDESRSKVHGDRGEDEALRVLYVGRLVYWKGLHLALPAFAKLQETYPRSRLTVIGSGPDEAWFRGLAEHLGILAAVTWIPWLDRVAVMEAYSLHDVFLFPSLHDSSGNVVLEALSQGLPVVCLDAGGPAELVDSSCGFRVRPGTPTMVVERLAQSLVMLTADVRLRRDMQTAAMCRAHEHFSWGRQTARMERLYLTLRKGLEKGVQDAGQQIEGGIP